MQKEFEGEKSLYTGISMKGLIGFLLDLKEYLKLRCIEKMGRHCQMGCGTSAV